MDQSADDGQQQKAWTGNVGGFGSLLLFTGSGFDDHLQPDVPANDEAGAYACDIQVSFWDFSLSSS